MGPRVGDARSRRTQPRVSPPQSRREAQIGGAAALVSKSPPEGHREHLHAFARDINLTPAEWLFGIGFITQIGQTCTDSRQETILLSDTLGLSALVNALHDKTRHPIYMAFGHSGRICYN